MKTLISKYWLVLMALVSVCMFTACSSDDDDTVSPVFPQVQTLAGEAGAEMDFTFEANENWSLASSAIWCKMSQGENADAFVINGKAGKQTIKVKLTDDDASKDLSVAQLVLTMGDQKAAIAEVKRSADGYTIKVYDEEGNDITESGLAVGYDDYTKFSVEANYRFAVTNTPDWVELEGGFMVGRANEKTEGGVMFKEGAKNAKYAISAEEGNTITIASEDGKAVKTIPVRYNGMPTNTMDVTYPTSSPWADWTVSMDGKTYSQTGSTGVTGESSSNTFTFTNFVPFTLKTFGDEYSLIVFQKMSDGLEPVYERFVKTTGEGGDIRLSVDALSSGERECYVYALPTAEAESLGNPDKMIDEDGNVSWQYNKYFLMHFIQKEQTKGDSDESTPVITVNGYQNVTCTKDKDNNYHEVASEYLNYDGDEIYVATVNVGDYVTVMPNIAGYAPEDLSDIFGLSSWGTELTPEFNMDESGNYTFSYEISEEAPYFIAFKQNGVTVKVVVLDRNWDSESRKHFSIKKIRK